MPTVTSILPHARRAGRFNVVVDRHDSSVLSIEAIERLRLAVGTPVDPRTSAALEREASILATYDRAVNMLAARARSSAELRRLLMRKGEPNANIAAAIERLERAGYLDDASYARQFARSKVLNAGLSRRRVAQELARKGVPRMTSEAALDDVFAEDGLDDMLSIDRVARKKARTLAKLDPVVQRRRLYGYLARRGFDGDDIDRIIDRLTREHA